MTAADTDFGGFMKRVRKERGMTQRELAAYLDVTQPEISNIESGKLAAPQEFKTRFCERMGMREEPPAVRAPTIPPPAAPPPQGPAAGASGALVQEIQAARKELNAPMAPEEAAALHGVEMEQLITSSTALKAALELRTARDLLAAARVSRRRWEAKARET